MKKLFTILAAVLVSVSMFAAEFTLFNGTGSTMPSDTRQVDATTGFAYTFANFKTTFVNVSEFADHGSYVNAVRYGGGTTSAKNYLLLEIPANYNASIDVVYGSSSTDLPSFGISTDGTKPNGSNCSEWNATVGAAATLYSETISDLEGGQSYYLGGSADKCILAYVKVTLTPSCEDPEFTVSPTEGIGYVGDPIDITISSKNQSKPINPAVTVDGVEAVYGTDYTFSASTGLVQATPLKAGTFVITFTQASNGTYCDAEDSATFVISEKAAVTSFEIEGPTSARVGDTITLTATNFDAAATSIWWTDKYGTTLSSTAEYTFTPEAEGDVVLTAWAENEFNESSPVNLEHTVSVTIGHNAYLSDLKVNGTTIDGFDDEIFEYNLGEIGVYEPVNVTATPADAPYATATVNPGNNNVLITVFAQDKTTSNSYTITYTRAAATPLASIGASTTWDWANAGSATAEQKASGTLPLNTQEFNFADVLINPAESFNAAALAGIAQFANRSGYFQGTQIKFNTTVAGHIVIDYSNTGGDRPYRHVEVNGVQSAEGSASSTKITSEIFNVNAGDVIIKFYIPNASSPQSREGDVVGYTMGRVYKIVFTKGWPTAVDNTVDNAKAIKTIENGQLVIIKNGVKYNVLGAELR